MRAAICTTSGNETVEIVDDLVIGDPGPGEVRVRIHAAGLCHSDLSGMQGSFPRSPRSSPATRGPARWSP